jgi:hypothetical protein
MKKALITMMLVIAAVTTLAQRQWVGELGSGNREAHIAHRQSNADEQITICSGLLDMEETF